MTAKTLPTTSWSRVWQEILQSVVTDHHLAAAVLTNFQGLPFATALHPDLKDKLPHDPTHLLGEILAAFAPPLLRVGAQLERYIGSFQLDEVRLRTRHAYLIVARQFPMGEDPFILTVLVPPRRAYRRAMNLAIRKLQATGRRAL